MMAGDEAQTALRLHSSPGPVKTGLLTELAAFYKRQTGRDVTITAADPAAVMDAGRAGAADLLFAEVADIDAAYLDEGIALARVALIANDFLLVGPADDPAGISALSSVLAAFRRIAGAGAPFLSAPEGSLARRKEQEIWALAGLPPQAPQGRTMPADSTPPDLLREAVDTGDCRYRYRRGPGGV
ncbi:MAG: hypothetical protein NTZ05_00170 [Chloroflexi bacterium]|nr:hypothetical protein [Chloroflexota bacterium]